MALNKTIQTVTDRILKRSEARRALYMDRMGKAASQGPARAHLTCGNQAHAFAAMDKDKRALAACSAGNVGIVTAYNDMLSAHQPFETYPQIIKEAARGVGGTAQVAGGVPAMCDGVTQGQAGMDLSLFSRDLIAMSAGIALSHNTFDAAVFLGVCDKIVPGMVITAATFGHLPTVFIPAGPMSSGLPNDEKANVRNLFAEGKVGREELLAAEMASYHGAGTCTFYGTANTNQMLMEVMGLHLPGSSFVSPHHDLRERLTQRAVETALGNTKLTDHYVPTCDILDARTYVNGIVGLMATGGSTNLLIHLIAMARASGVVLEWNDFADISAETPLMARVYPNGLADVNHFHAAGGLGLMIAGLLEAGLLHDDTQTIMGAGLNAYTQEPKIIEDVLAWQDGPKTSLNDKIIRTVDDPFQTSGGLSALHGNLGEAVMKVSAVKEEHRIVTAPVRVFHDQPSVRAAFQAGELEHDVIIVVRFQGPSANGMPELHSLTPCLSVLQGRGFKVGLLTDGRMSGASGKVPAAIHLSPEALDGGMIAKLADGDMVTMDAVSGKLFVHDETVLERPNVIPDLTDQGFGAGRELFATFRAACNDASKGASIFEG
jgi:phosphogluconate dehydratase